MDMNNQVSALAMTQDTITKNIKRIGVSGKAYDNLVHITGVALIVASMPIDQGGQLDAGKALDYVKSLSAGSSRNRVVAWLHEFSNMRFSTIRSEDNSLKITMQLLKPTHPQYKDARPIEANATPFWELNHEGNPVSVEFTDKVFVTMINNMLLRAKKAQDAAKVGQGTFNVSPAVAAQLALFRKTEDAERVIEPNH
jgi:hypothetical protein